MDITTSELSSVKDHIVQEVTSQLSIQSALNDRITLTQTLLRMSDELGSKVEVEGFFEVRKDYGNGVIGKRGTVQSVLRIRKEILEFKKWDLLEGKQQTKFTRIWTRRCARCSTSER
ncbi:hypothetical protein PSHT_14226 [Puccinia striiformis]|uniref:Uncharacterized protein n=1 Tax=Puccinia striiformis TaxID=27350 RepID=A0A2S4ULE1_9BASI|nr:hypothetical protein PSHT_14226 [Puccinia striiformis]